MPPMRRDRRRPARPDAPTAARVLGDHPGEPAGDRAADRGRRRRSPTSNLNGNIAEGERDRAPAQEVRRRRRDDEPDEPLNILVMGSDTRVGEGNDIDGGTDGRRALRHHDPAARLGRTARNAYGVSLPRDAIIDRPDCTRRRRDRARRGRRACSTPRSPSAAPQCTVQTVEALTGIYIDHFLVLDFNGFKDMVDAVDGVEVCIPKAVDDDEHDIHFDAGTQVLSGQQALNYVRERYELSVTGDIGRMKRQQAFIASMINKVMLGRHPDAARRRSIGFLDAVTSSIQVDAELDTRRQARRTSRMRVPRHRPRQDQVHHRPDRARPDEPDLNRLCGPTTADELWERIRQDQKLGKDFSEGSIGADDKVGTTDEPTTRDEPTDPRPTTPAPTTPQRRAPAGRCQRPARLRADRQDRCDAALHGATAERPRLDTTIGRNCEEPASGRGFFCGVPPTGFEPALTP